VARSTERADVLCVPGVGRLAPSSVDHRNDTDNYKVKGFGEEEISHECIDPIRLDTIDWNN
jgi:hypothetical protein